MFETKKIEKKEIMAILRTTHLTTRLRSLRNNLLNAFYNGYYCKKRNMKKILSLEKIILSLGIFPQTELKKKEQRPYRHRG